ncbi:MAG TPA: hypothetical protein VK590_01435 [Saprospiraceae bacterium]|nr:hypothetical protein [Saprospiraceae bacterium]
MPFKYQLIIAGLVIILSACSTKFYVPTTLNVPVIQEKGQCNLTIAGNGNQLEARGAYGISDAIALQLNGSFIFPKDEDNGDGGSGNLTEAGVGYYKNISSDFLFDTYALFGVGSLENHFPSTLQDNPNTSGNISAGIYRVGLQPSISFHKKYFSIIGSARISSVNYSNIKGSLIFDNEDQIKYLEDNKSNLIVEPALTLRAGLENLKLQLQLVKSFNLSNSNFKQDDNLLSVGLNYDLK